MRTTPLKGTAATQRGAATVFVTMVLILAVMLIAAYTNREAIMEQRLSANEVRAKQAFAAANAGIEHALAYLRSGGLDHNNDGTVDTITSDALTNGTGQATYYKVAYCGSAAIPVCPATHAGALACAAPTDITKVAAVACGWSDDDSSVQRLVQVMGATPSLGGTISTPVIARGTVNLLTGGATIMNYFNDLTVWSGGSLLGQSNTGKTFIRDIVSNPTASLADPYRTTGTSPACLSPPAGYQCSTQGSTLGHDTVFGDTNLSSMTADGLFNYIFGQAPDAYRAETATWVVDPAGTGNSTVLNSIVGMTDQTIWVEGDASLPGDIGTQDHPVILVINGNFDMGANSVINGLVYVNGNITGNGSPTIYGALIGAGGASATGNLKVVYDPKVLGRAANLGKAGKVQGSWRDW
jgi:Tfp pilus assembly protein PilX